MPGSLVLLNLGMYISMQDSLNVNIVSIRLLGNNCLGFDGVVFKF
jgi:hypothetical protein